MDTDRACAVVLIGCGEASRGLRGAAWLLALTTVAQASLGAAGHTPEGSKALAGLWQIAARYERGELKAAQEGDLHVTVPEFLEAIARDRDAVEVLIQATRACGTGPPARPWPDSGTGTKLHFFRSGARTALGDSKLRRAAVARLTAIEDMDTLWMLFRRRELEELDVPFLASLLAQCRSHRVGWVLSEVLAEGTEWLLPGSDTGEEEIDKAGARTQALLRELGLNPGAVGRFWLAWTLTEWMGREPDATRVNEDVSYWGARIRNRSAFLRPTPTIWSDRFLLGWKAYGTVGFGNRDRVPKDGQVLSQLDQLLQLNPHHLGALAARGITLRDLSRRAESDEAMELLKERAGAGIFYGEMCYRFAKRLFAPQRRLHYCLEYRSAGLTGPAYPYETELCFLAYLAAGRMHEARKLAPEMDPAEAAKLAVPFVALAIFALVIVLVVLRRRKPLRDQPTLGQAVGLSIAYLLAQAPLAIVFGLWQGLVAGALMVIVGYGVLYRQLPTGDDGFCWRGKKLGIGLPVCGGVACVIASATISTAMASLGWEPPHQAIRDLIAGASTVENVLVVLVVVLLVPAAEEVLFRGLWFRALRARFGPAIGATASAVTFAAFHFEPAFFPQFIALGLIFAWVYHRTRSLLSVSICHGLNNAAGVAVIWLM